jgi:predicted metal-dependent peptidase
MMVIDTGSNDPFAVLENAARKQEAFDKVMARMSKARERLVFSRGADATFWATLSLKLKIEASDTEVDTMGTDGRRLVCNPEFVASLSEEERVGVVAHEVAHCAFAHMVRLENRDKYVWNVAGDLVINPILQAAGFKLPHGHLLPGVGEYHDIPAGLSTEETYRKLMEKKRNKSGDDDDEEGKQPGDPGGCGQVLSAPDKSEAGQRELEEEIKVAVAQAAYVANQRGKLTEGLARIVAEVLEPETDVADVLRQFVTQFAKNDYAWLPPNRRFVHQGIYLPSMRSEELGDVVVSLDTSGSIDDETISVFMSRIEGILEVFPRSQLTIIYHHARVYHVQQWKGDDGPLKLAPTESGGTSHVPVFEKVKELGIEPTCMVCLTDMYSDFPPPPTYPVLWASTSQGEPAPFGQLVEVQ